MLLFTISQLPPNCSDSDIRNALLPYGAVHEMQIRYDRNEVNVTMEATSSALTLVRHQRSLVVRGATVPISQAPRAPQHSAPSHSQHNFSQHQHHIHHPHHQPQQWQQPAAQDASYAVQQSSTVFITVEQCQYPINEGVLREVFTRVGTIVDVSCSPAGGPTTTGTVTFASHASADAAVRDLNGKQIYPNCCIMHITKVQPAISYSPAPAAMPFFQHAPQFMLQHHGQQPPQVGSFVMNNGYSSAPPSQHGAYAPAPSVGMPPTRGGSMGGRGGRGVGGRGGLMMPGHDMAPPSAPYGGTPEAPVLIISNVTESASLHSLWVLLEVYGNVNSLKRQHTHKTSVVAMFQNLHDARGAVVHLQNCPFFGSVLSVKHFAGYQDRGGSRVEWNAGPATDPNTIAYQFHANHHRTKPSAPYNPKQKNRPDCNLFISNLTEEITDTMVEELFTSRGFQVVEHYRKAMNASIVRLDSVEKSVEALIATHAQQVNGRYVYVAFSRFAPGPAPANAGESGEESGNNQFAETAGYNEDAAVQQQ